jgi:hypothetical protein
MTVTTDLATNYGKYRRLFLKIDGLEPVLWQRSSLDNARELRKNIFEDDFDNYTKDREYDERYGVVTETESHMNISIPAGTNGDWWTSTYNSPMCWEHPYPDTPSTTLSFIARCQGINMGGANCDFGMHMWNDYANAYWTQFNTSTIWHARIVSNVVTTGLGTQSIDNPNLAPLQIRYDFTPSTEALDIMWSQDEGASWTTLYSYPAGTMPFIPVSWGCFTKNWGTKPACDATWSWWRVTDSRSVKICLRPPKELSLDLNLGDMTMDMSAMTFELDDIEDEDDPGKSYFGKLFAPARWSENNHWRLQAATEPNNYIDANVANIELKDVTSVDTSGGLLYTGQETISYSGVTGTTLTGVSKGLFPCIGTTNYGFTYPRPRETDPGTLMHFGEVPFTFHGRRVALYAVTYDTVNNKWHEEDDAVLMWTGRISNTINYIPKMNKWQLSCTSILQELEENIGTNFPYTELFGINLGGPVFNRTFYIDIWDGTNNFSYGILVPQGHYIWQEYTGMGVPKPKITYNDGTAIPDFGKAVAQAVRDVLPNKFDVTVGAGFITLRNEKSVGGGVNFTITWPQQSVIFRILGFDREIKATTSENRLINDFHYVIVQGQQAYASFHSINDSWNGGKLYVTDPTVLWNDQGDDNFSRAHVMMPKAIVGEGDEKGTYFVTYSAKDEDKNNLTLTGQRDRIWYERAFVGKKIGDTSDAGKVQQLYVPVTSPVQGATARGPFEMLLYPLLSTGTRNYNHSTYDKLPLTLSCGIHSDLVDTASFLRADGAIKGKTLAVRRFYPLGPKAFSWMDLVKREAQLFGLALVWNRGQLKIKDVVYPSADTWIDELDSSTSAVSDELPDVTMSGDTVINQYKCNVIFNHNTGKYEYPIEITDIDSKMGVYIVKQVTIEHPGLSLGSNPQHIEQFLRETLLSDRNRMLRYPSQVVKVSLKPTLLRKINMGDIVKYTSTKLPDPLGSGNKSMTVYALVLSVKWDYSSWIGSATLMLLSQYANYGNPWGPTAVSNIEVTNGGWDSSENSLVVQAWHYGDDSTDDHDGNAFEAGDKVMVIEAAPSNTANPLIWTGLEIASAYQTDGTCKLSFADSPLMTGWDANLEYAVLYDDYDASPPADQIARGIWQADDSNEFLNVSTTALRWA